MRINFRQGVVGYGVSGNAQSFLVKTGAYVSLHATAKPVTVAFAYKDADYLHTESSDVTNAWGPIPASTFCWLYWDIDLNTGHRSFGFTTVEPEYDPIDVPGVEDQHWFNTTTNTMNVYTNGRYREVVRVFAGVVQNSTFSPLGLGYPLRPYSGSQIEIYDSSMPGRIIVDTAGAPIRRTNGAFFTTESDFFINGSQINSVRLEATVVTGEAVEPMAKYHVVKFSSFGKLTLAGYNDIQTTVIAMVMEDLVWEEVGNVCVQGQITNLDWNWSAVGAPLWVYDSGLLTEQDPHVTNALIYPIGKPPIARVLTPTTIIFDQGLGGKGDQGVAGLATGVSFANGTTYGVSRLSVAPTSLDDPVAVGSNDPRLSNSVLKSGGMMTGPLILSTNPVTLFGAATKQYVDTSIDGIDYTALVQRSGDVMLGPLTLAADPVGSLQASTKQYVDAAIGSGRNMTWKNPVRLASTVNIPSLVGLLIVDNVQTFVGDRVLVKNQTNTVQNGIYTVSLASWTRTPDTADSTSLLSGSVFYVCQGVLHNTQAFVVTTVNTINPGVTPIEFGSFNRNQLVVLSGDITGSGTTSIPVVLSPSGALAGTYTSITVNAKGIVTTGSNPTTLANMGITDGMRLTGDIMSGFLTLVGAPLNPLHAATKAYVDAATSGAGFTVNGGLALVGTVLAVSTASVARIVVNSNNIDLASSGITPGTYNSVTVDTYGRVTDATVTGNSTITLTGDVSGAGTSSFAVTLATTGVGAGTYKSVTVDIKGRVLSGSNPTTIGGYGITDAVRISGDTMTGNLVLGTSDTISASNNRITRVQDPASPQDVATKNYVDTVVGGSIIPGNGLAFTGGTLNIVPVNTGRIVVAPGTIDLGQSGTATGTYTSVTVDLYGRVTNGTNPTPVLNISFANDVTGNGTTGSPVSLTLANVTTAGTVRNKFNVDAKGRIVASSTETTLAGLGIVDVIDSLSDVTIAGVLANQVLTYNGTMWVNATPSASTDKLVGITGVDNSPGYLSTKLDFPYHTFSQVTSYPSGDERLTVQLSTPPTLTNGATYGFQTVNVGGAVIGTTNTGLVSGTTYTSTITINGVGYPVSVLGSTITSFRTLITAIDAAIAPNGQASIVGGNIRVTSSRAGAGSTVSIDNTGGSSLFSSLPLYVNINTAVTGTTSGTFNTFDVDVYGRVIVANNSSGTNQNILLSGDATGSGATAITVTLSNTGVVPGTYRQVEVDAKGRVLVGANPTTLVGYGIVDAQPLNPLLSTLVSTGFGILAKTATNTTAAVTLTGTTGRISVSSGGASGGNNPTFDLSTSGVTAGTYTKTTVDVYGRVITGSTITTADVGGIGTISTQNAGAVAITGGTITGTSTAPRIVTQSYAASITLNWAVADIIRITLTGNIILSFSGGFDGQKCLLELTQDATGGRSVVFVTTPVPAARFGTDIVGYTPSAAGNKTDRIGFIYTLSSSTYDVIAIARGY